MCYYTRVNFVQQKSYLFRLAFSLPSKSCEYIHKKKRKKERKIDWLRYFILHKAQIYLNIREKCFELHSQYNTIKIIIIINVDIMRADTHTLVACTCILVKKKKQCMLYVLLYATSFSLCVWLYREIILFLFFSFTFYFSCFPASAR